jgi:hypothetical protein
MMAIISSKSKRTIEDLFGMNTGYVIDFSNSTFERFIFDSIGLKVYEDEGYTEYESKANKLRTIIASENTSKVAKLLIDMLDYYYDLKLKKDDLTEYDRKKIDEVKIEMLEILEKGEEGLDFADDLHSKIQLISTRNAKFSEMSTNEKLKEIANLLENILKKDGKYIEVNFSEITFGFFSNESVKEYKKSIQCFRHSSEDSLHERDKFTEVKKLVYIDIGIFLCNVTYNSLI